MSSDDTPAAPTPRFVPTLTQVIASDATPALGDLPTLPSLDVPDDVLSPAAKAALQEQVKKWRDTATRYETEPETGEGRKELMARAKVAEEKRDRSMAAYHLFEYGAACFQVAIVVARTEAGASWFLVDTDTPGYRLVRDIPNLEPFELGSHGEIVLENCRVCAEALIGEQGRGLEYAQLRLEGARLFHCMRFVGLASRAMDIAQDYAARRESYGVRLGDHQMVQAMIADAHIQLYAARMVTRDVARRLDAGESIRHHSSMAKVFVSEAVGAVADSAVQICGALGISGDTPVSMIYRQVRPFRIYDGASEVHRSAIAKRALLHRISA